MKNKFAALPLLILLFLPAKLYSADPSVKQEDMNYSASTAETVSIIQLIANPEKYNGKTVLIIGYVRFEFESSAAYLSEEDYKHVITKNALWLDINADIAKNTKKFNKKYCLIMGTFDSENKGHMGLNSGAIKDIKRFEIWGERQD